MNRKIPERYVWAVGILDVQADDAILEVGCGYGHSIPLICEKFKSGHLTAIDRSEKMVAAARKSNTASLDTGSVTILHQDLLDGELPPLGFDKIFLFNINVFWMDPREELAEIGRLLNSSGRFYLFHQPPPGHDLKEFETALRNNLEKYEFAIIDRFKDERDAIRSIALTAEPSPQ